MERRGWNHPQEFWVTGQTDATFSYAVAQQFLAGCDLPVARRNPERVLRVRVDRRFDFWYKCRLLKMLDRRIDELLLELIVAEIAHACSLGLANLGDNLRALRRIGECFAQIRDMLARVGVGQRTIALEGFDCHLPFFGIGHVTWTAGLAELRQALVRGCARKALNPGLRQLRLGIGVGAFSGKNAVGQHIVDYQSLLDFAEL